MKTTKENTIKVNIQEIIPVLQEHQVIRAGLFGSITEGTSTENSDVDILVEFRGEKGLFDLVSLKLDLEEKLDKKVDVLTYDSLNPLIKEKVLAQETKVL